MTLYVVSRPVSYMTTDLRRVSLLPGDVLLMLPSPASLGEIDFLCLSTGDRFPFVDRAGRDFVPWGLQTLV